ncbi:hypothetical protein [Clostridium sp.]|uniref:hypothetical protein n=1 Tax=Clostridium sp. TaxID=1506 RepID=UPI003F34294D
MKVINESRMDFNYRLSSEQPIVTETIYSNRVVTYIVLDGLEVEKLVSKKEASPFDILTYDINIKNPTKDIKKNIYFTDCLNENSIYIKNTLYIKDKQVRCKNNLNAIYIGDVLPNEIIRITFKAVTLCCKGLNVVKNKSEITFEYKHNIDEEEIELNIESNEVYTSIKNNLFKVFKSQGCILRVMPNVNYIIRVQSKISIIKTKLVETPIVSTVEHNEETLCKLIVIAVIEYKIIYEEKRNSYINICDREKIIKEYKVVQGISTSLSIPYGVNFCKDLKCKASLINTEYEVFDCGSSIFLSSNILIKIR